MKKFKIDGGLQDDTLARVCALIHDAPAPRNTADRRDFESNFSERVTRACIDPPPKNLQIPRPYFCDRLHPHIRLH